MEMNPDDLRAYARRDWGLVARSKARYWRDLFDARGPEPGLRATERLRAFVRLQQPDWPSEEDRTHDLENHVRVAALFARAARHRD